MASPRPSSTAPNTGAGDATASAWPVLLFELVACPSSLWDTGNVQPKTRGKTWVPAV